MIAIVKASLIRKMNTFAIFFDQNCDQLCAKYDGKQYTRQSIVCDRPEYTAFSDQFIYDLYLCFFFKMQVDNIVVLLQILTSLNGSCIARSIHIGII